MQFCAHNPSSSFPTIVTELFSFCGLLLVGQPEDRIRQKGEDERMRERYDAVHAGGQARSIRLAAWLTGAGQSCIAAALPLESSRPSSAENRPS